MFGMLLSLLIGLLCPLTSAQRSQVFLLRLTVGTRVGPDTKLSRVWVPKARKRYGLQT